jgi:hypothetical protein
MVDDISSPTLLQRLAQSIPPPRRGVRLFEQALAAARLSELPHGEDDLLAFLRGPLRELLMEELGPRLGEEVLRDVESAAERVALSRRCDTLPAVPVSIRKSSIPARSLDAPRVLLVGRDRIQTAPIARGLIREGCMVSVANEAAELVAALGDGGPDSVPSVVVLEERDAFDLPRALHGLLREHPNVTVVVHGCQAASLAEPAIRARGAQNVQMVSARSTAADLVAIVGSIARRS